MSDVESIAKVMQSKGYCEKSSYQWICHVLSSMVDSSILDKVAEIANSQLRPPTQDEAVKI